MRNVQNNGIYHFPIFMAPLLTLQVGSAVRSVVHYLNIHFETVVSLRAFGKSFQQQ